MLQDAICRYGSLVGKRDENGKAQKKVVRRRLVLARALPIHVSRAAVRRCA
jgi:hypothetical protein